MGLQSKKINKNETPVFVALLLKLLENSHKFGMQYIRGHTLKLVLLFFLNSNLAKILFCNVSFKSMVTFFVNLKTMWSVKYFDNF